MQNQTSKHSKCISINWVHCVITFQVFCTSDQIRIQHVIFHVYSTSENIEPAFIQIEKIPFPFISNNNYDENP